MKKYDDDFYLPGANIPEPFRAADEMMHNKTKRPNIAKKHKEVPTVEGPSDTIPVVFVSDEWYYKKKRKKKVNQAKDARYDQIEMMRLMCMRDQIRAKLGQLDPSNKKDAKKILKANIKLNDIDIQIKTIEEQSGINAKKLDHGTRFSRFKARVKKKVSSIKKKVKKWYHENKKEIDKTLEVIIPLLVTSVVKIIQAKITKTSPNWFGQGAQAPA